MLELNANEIEILKSFEGYHLARYNGHLGIWSVFTEDIDWDASKGLPGVEVVYLDEPVELAWQMDDDCDHLLDPQFEGVFECRVLDIAEGKYLAATEGAA